MNKMWEMIIDDGTNVYRAHGVARDKKALEKTYGGNGEFVRIKEVTEDFPISEESVYKALKSANFGQAETEAIVSILRCNYENTCY